MVIAKIYFTLDMKTMKQISEGNICDQRMSVYRSNHNSVTFKPGFWSGLLSISMDPESYGAN